MTQSVETLFVAGPNSIPPLLPSWVTIDAEGNARCYFSVLQVFTDVVVIVSAQSMEASNHLVRLGLFLLYLASKTPDLCSPSQRKSGGRRRMFVA